MINKDGGQGEKFWMLWEDTAVMREDIELIDSPVPSTRENPAWNGSFWKKCSCEPCL